MPASTLILLFATVGFAVAWALTGLVRRWALSADLLDVPNDRSSHVQPTPRGGGVAIVMAYLAFLVADPGGHVAAPLTAALAGGGALVALLGLADDRLGLAARWRFLGHAVAVAWLLAWLPPLPMFGMQVPLGLAVPLLLMLYGVWMINLYNFMDGIDGIASVEAITVALGGALVWQLAGSDGGWVAPLLLAACVAGFLAWNFPPAKIFMGDAGSGFLGFMVAALSLWSALEQPSLFWSWLILTAAFMTDATITLIRRVLRGEKFYLAHRSHAYQYASRLYQSHKVVTLAFGAINVFWLFPWALAVALGWIDGALALVIAYTPLVLLAFHYKAGDRAAQGDLA